MKTRMWWVGTVSTAIISLTGCAQGEEERAKASQPAGVILPASPGPETPAPNPLLSAAPAVAPAPTPAAPATNLTVGAELPKAASAPAAGAKPEGTNAIPVPKVVQEPTLPENVTLSPVLQDVAKLAHAGVSDEVILTYINNSTNVLNVGSEAIVYLNDLGVSLAVIKTLIERDTSPEAKAQRQAATAVQPLPTNLVLHTPAPNIYPGANVGQSATEPAPAAALPPAYAETTAPVTTVAPTEPVPAAAPQQPVTVNQFYNYLSPYGTWVEVGDLGWCWRPTVAVTYPGWQPYCHGGRWLSTDLGWYWYSDYSWGWAPFHYGRWFCHGGYGWLWYPDTCWGPSWVSWRYTPGYCGWAPLAPGWGFSVGVGLTYHGGPWSVSFGVGWGWSDYCTYVPWYGFYGHHPHHYAKHGTGAASIHADSIQADNIVQINGNNNVVNIGPRSDTVQKYARKEIPKTSVREVAMRTPGQRMERLEANGSRLVVARPELVKSAAASSGVANPGRTAGAPEANRPSPIGVRKFQNDPTSASASSGVAGHPLVTKNTVEGGRQTSPQTLRASRSAAPLRPVPRAEPRSVTPAAPSVSAPPTPSTPAPNTTLSPSMSSPRRVETPLVVRRSSPPVTSSPAQVSRPGSYPGAPSGTSSRSPAPSVNSTPSPPRTITSPPAPRAEPPRATVIPSTPSVTRSVPATPAPSRPAPSLAPRPSAPSFAPPTRAPSYSPPPAASAPSFTPRSSAPSFSPAPRAPSFSAPSARSAPSFTPRASAPSFAPSRAPSASPPSRSSNPSR